MCCVLSNTDQQSKTKTTTREKYLSKYQIQKIPGEEGKKHILPLKHLPVDLPQLQPAVPSLMNAKTQAKLPDQQHFCVIICSRVIFKTAVKKRELPVRFLTVREKNLRKVEKHNATQQKNLDKHKAVHYLFKQEEFKGR